jgi:hypothetical protein
VFGGAVLAGAWPAFQSAEAAIPLSEGARWVDAWHPSLWLTLPRFLLRDAAAAGHEVSPFLVIVLPALLPFGRVPTAVSALRLASALSIGVWAGAGGGQVRLLAPAFPLIALAVAGALRTAPPVLVRPATGLAAVLGWWRLSVFLYQAASPVNVVLGSEPERAYLARVLTPHGLYMATGSFLRERPDLGRPYVAGDIKAYGWPRDPLVDSEFTIPHFVRWARDSRGPLELRRKLRQRGIGCVVHRMEGAAAMERMAGGYPWTDRSLAVLQKFMVSELVLEQSFDRPSENVYYRIWAARRPPPEQPSMAGLRWIELPYAESLSENPDRALFEGRRDEAERGYRELAARFPSLAIPHLRLAEIARLRGQETAMAREDRAAARLLGLGAR